MEEVGQNHRYFDSVEGAEEGAEDAEEGAEEDAEEGSMGHLEQDDCNRSGSDMKPEACRQKCSSYCWEARDCSALASAGAPSSSSDIDS